MRFFYGSNRSKLWFLYREHVDNAIILPIQEANILNSLAANRTAISDTIISCERNDYSASDDDLINKSWNIQGVSDLLTNGVTRILCTSKRVMNDLRNEIICPPGLINGTYEHDLSIDMQTNFIGHLNGQVRDIRTPIANVFLLPNGKKVEVVSIPSPGSSQRSVQHFGYYDGNKVEYARRYFQHAFQWLVTA